MQERMEESPIYQLTLQEGIEQGMERGMERGIERGKILQSSDFLLASVRKYDDADLLQRAQEVIAHNQDAAQLSQLVFQISAASTRADVLALLAANLPDARQR